MRHRKHRHRLGRSKGHREAVLENLATSLFLHERIRTTLAKARALRPFAEPLITLAKTDNLHNRRLVFRNIRDKEVLRKLFSEIGPRVGDRPGGYLRIIKTVSRPGDGAEMAYIELVDRKVVETPGAAQEEPKKKGLIQRMLGR